MILEKYSFGVGDRFGMEGISQLKALIKGSENGISWVPVWNKSNREHQIIGTNPNDVRIEADNAVMGMAYKGPYYVDADHINSDTVDPFIIPSDFFTMDVASYIGKSASKESNDKALDYLGVFQGEIVIPGINKPFEVKSSDLIRITDKYLQAIIEAGSLYKYLCEEKGEDNFIAEVSMDEVDTPQTPLELFFILALIAREGIKVQTIAPKFSGRFNKGVDYVGDLHGFRKEFEEDLLVLDYAVGAFGLPSNLKLSIHSGSDKFSIYPIIGELIMKHDSGIHIKTAGTTWLEEVIGLSLGDSKSLQIVKDIYSEAFSRQKELCSPYSDVINIDGTKLPDPAKFQNWTGNQIADSIRHIPNNPSYNLNIRQLLHVAYKLAAERGLEYLEAIQRNEDIISRQVEDNIFHRHLMRLIHQ